MKPQTNNTLLTAGCKRHVLASCVALLMSVSTSGAVLAQSVAANVSDLTIASSGLTSLPVGEVSLV
ncbi:MAG: hypothetical protein Q8M35_04745, partial [Pseudohongiella sp.]|nr:hypothetical protein [Pseudohongiella sp.]